MIAILPILLSALYASAQSGEFTVTPSVVAGGGGTSAGSGFTVDGTLGQPVGGDVSAVGSFEVRSGFWGGLAPSVPTAAAVSVSGRVLTPDGRGLRNAVVKLTGSQGVTRTVTTSSFGLYSLENLQSGQTYVISVVSKLYRFAPRTLPVNDNLTGMDFVGVE